MVIHETKRLRTVSQRPKFGVCMRLACKLSGLTSKAVNPDNEVTPEACIDHALMQRFERASVAHDRRILASAYRHAVADTRLSIESITQSFRQDKRIIRIQDGLKTMCTTREVLAEEKRMVDLARAGKGQLVPLYAEVPPLSVTGEHAAAITHVLTSTDRVSNVQGGAGTGKTTTLKQLVGLIQRVDVKTTLVAPTASASRGELREQGFDKADTVSRLLADSEMQNELQDGVLIVDEAGLLGVRDMVALLQLGTEKNARLILIGDTRQHASVIRGDALRILNTVAGIKPAEINKIYRQRQDGYRKAVEDIAAGNIQSAFDRLEAFGGIIETDAENLNAQLVSDYMAAIYKGKTALVVSPTHAQGEAVTAEIRKALRDGSIIGKNDIHVTRYINLNYTEAEKADASMYQPGFAVQFSQNLTGIQRGSMWDIREATNNQVTIATPDGKALPLPLDKAHQFTVYRKTIISLAIGDAVTITRGSFDRNGKRLNNGQSLKVVSVHNDGDIMLMNPVSRIEYRFGKEFGHISHGYTTTSYAAQGKTVDEVFIAQPASVFVATNMKQFYVSVSRAGDMVYIYSDDKEALLDHVSEIGNRESALELIGRPEQLSQHIAQHLARFDQPTKPPNKLKKPQPEQKERPVRPHAPKLV
jgi:hypothetical protein